MNPNPHNRFNVFNFFGTHFEGVSLLCVLPSFVPPGGAVGELIGGGQILGQMGVCSQHVEEKGK